jgi:hypothetical protein
VGLPQYGGAGPRNTLELMGQDLSRVVGSGNRVWLVLSFQNIPRVRKDAGTTMSWLDQNGYEVADGQDFNQVRVLLFEKMAEAIEPAEGREGT